MKLSGNKNTDFIILMKLEDHELVKVCSVNKYINSLCKDDNFWLSRIFNKIGYSYENIRDMKKYLEFDNYREFYIWLVEHKNLLGEILASFLNKEKIKIIDKALYYFKMVNLPKWINGEEFYKIYKRIGIIVVDESLYTDFHIDEENDDIYNINFRILRFLTDEHDLSNIFIHKYYDILKKFDEK